MANLIITIIAIALVAVMAIAGIWYGSSAFQEAQAKAEANKILSNFKQVDGAIKVFAVENGGSLPDCASDWPVNCAQAHVFSTAEMVAFLEPTFLQPGLLQTSKITIYRNPSWPMTNGYLIITGPSYSQLTSAVCSQLEAMRAGVVPSVNRPFHTAPSLGQNKSACGQFGCFADNVSNSWGTADFIAYYRHAGTPQSGQPDCTINP